MGSCCHEVKRESARAEGVTSRPRVQEWQCEESYPLEERRKRLVLGVMGVDEMKNMHLERPTQDQSWEEELSRSRHPGYQRLSAERAQPETEPVGLPSSRNWEEEGQKRARQGGRSPTAGCRAVPVRVERSPQGEGEGQRQNLPRSGGWAAKTQATDALSWGEQRWRAPRCEWGVVESGSRGHTHPLLFAGRGFGPVTHSLGFSLFTYKTLTT